MASFLSTVCFVLGLVLVVASNIHAASAEPSISFSDILLPSPNITAGAVGEIKCYALPYGAIGIISHLLTYWTVAWMAVGQAPLWPWHPMKDYRFDMFLAVLALLTCIPIASITVHRCRLSWHFVLICIWKLITSVSLACITLHRCAIIRRDRPNTKHHADNNHPDDEPQSRIRIRIYRQVPKGSQMFKPTRQAGADTRNVTPLWWMALHLCGTIVGMVGLCSLLYTTFRHDQTIRSLTYGFGAAMVVVPVLVAIYWFKFNLQSDKDGGKVYVMAFYTTFGGALLAFIAVFGFFSTLYSDLVLGSIADNLFGLPSEDFAPIYWAWFVAKRLPMFSL